MFFFVAAKNPECNKHMYTSHSEKHSSNNTQQGTTFLVLDKTHGGATNTCMP